MIIRDNNEANKYRSIVSPLNKPTPRAVIALYDTSLRSVTRYQSDSAYNSMMHAQCIECSEPAKCTDWKRLKIVVVKVPDGNK